MSEKIELIRHLEKNGLLGSVVSIEHLVELRQEIEKLKKNGLLDDYIYKTFSDPYFKAMIPTKIPKPKSLIIISIPQPPLITNFQSEGKIRRVTIPPTYYDYNKIYRRVRKILDNSPILEDFKFVRAALPAKLLAVRSGLALYGRNNITYVQKHGSFHRLMAFYSDFESPVDYWTEKKALPLCSKCKACMNACPTNTIQEDRFLIHVERCLPYHNEKDSKHKFPKFIKPSAHNCLIGCLICQKVCPYNKNVKNWYEERLTFEEDETEYLLRGKFSGKKAKKMNKKLKKIGVDLSIFPRNLKVLIDNHE